MAPQNPHILHRVASFIAQEGLLPARTGNDFPDQNPPLVFVGLSGGADSVALLHILHSLGYRCLALHCNFHLRGPESDRDEAFCRTLCQGLQIPLMVRSFDTYQYMAQQHLSLEMAARRLRYDWWAQVLANASSDQRQAVIALGHHQDDSIETLLMNLMRGTGIQGLTGIVARNEHSHVVRPLLCLQRSEILDYLQQNGLTYVTDSTNLQNDTLRNQIRNQLLPLMEQLLPQARQGIITSMQHLQGTQYFAEQFLSQTSALTHHHCQWGIEWDEILLSDIAQAFPQHTQDYIHYWEQRYAASADTRVCRDALRLYTSPLSEQTFIEHRPTLSIATTGTNNNTTSTNGNTTGYRTSAQSLTQQFDADTVQLPLTVRCYQQADRMAPLGLAGHTKLVSDLFHDAHYSPMQKATTWLVADATGAIIWVAGLRISELHKVTGLTQHIMQLTLS